MKKHTTYKDSGIEWAPRIPIDWQARPVKGVFDVQLGKMLQNDAGSPDDLHVPYLKALHVNWGIVDTEDLPEMWAGAPELKQYGVRDGDLLVCEGGEVGRSGIVYNPPKNCIIQNALHRVRVENGADIRFLMYVLHAVASAEWFSILCNKATIAHFTREKLTALKIPIPNDEEQEQIADFLDCKVAQIDQLVAKKERMIELLKEERAAAINQAVTKGLDPNVETKDSGIEWLGKIPKHWQLKRLKHLLNDDMGIKIGPFGSALKSEFITSSGYKVYGQENVIADDFNVGYRYIDQAKFSELAVYELLAGDVIVTMMGTTGKSKVVPDGIPVGIMDSHLIRMRFNMLAIPEFVSMLINDSFYIYSQLKISSKGSIMEGLNSTIVCSLLIALPSKEEQEELLRYLKKELLRIDTILQKEMQGIGLLREYRTALISEAVTGKIDVRNA